MGGRGGAGGTKESNAWRMQTLQGSDKQVKWANDIIESAILSVDLMKKNIERLEKNGVTGDENAKWFGYTKQDVSAMKAFLQDGFQGVQKASDLINNRKRFEFDALEKRVKAIRKEGFAWSKKERKLIKK